ncbi:hypothetical protein HDU91_006534 [Kappamyces sp. JEL0680]|nr:hypothetical protein HDU91_006534 [Kappamyces sp. JEL0680]
MNSPLAPFLVSKLALCGTRPRALLPWIHRRAKVSSAVPRTRDAWRIPARLPIRNAARTYSSPPLKNDTFENIYTLPNALTVSRILLSPVIGVCIVQHSFSLGLGLLVLAGVTDALDGWIARRWKMQSAIGSVLDPAADKILMTTLVVSLTQAGSLPMSLGGLIIARDVYLALRTAYYRYVTLPEPKTWSRYWDFSLVSAEIQPPFISKVNTALQLLLMASCLTASVYGYLLHPALLALEVVVACTTIGSTLHYIFDKTTMKVR